MTDDSTLVKTPEVFCVPSCKGEGKAKKGKQWEMVRCCMCMKWFHQSCVNETENSGIWNCPDCRLLPSIVRTLLDTVKTLKQDMATLSQECAELRSENRDLHMKLTSQLPIDADQSPEASIPQQRSIADVVRNSVKNAINDEKCRNEVMISKAEEKGQDEKFISDLCTKMNFDTKPIEVTRMGEKSETRSHHRLLKVSFSTSFDARAFRSRFEQTKKTLKDIGSFRMRPGRSREEQEAFRKSNSLAHRLNKEAKDAKEKLSYSVRENGAIWQYKESDDGKWIRVPEWTASGNDHLTPKPGTPTH